MQTFRLLFCSFMSEEVAWGTANSFYCFLTMLNLISWYCTKLSPITAPGMLRILLAVRGLI